MSKIARVILEQSTLASSGLELSKSSVFYVRDKVFLRLDNPGQEHITLAESAIRSGLTAGIITTSTIKPKALFFDMDGTVIEEESLVEISKSAGKERQIGLITEKAMAGELDFTESLRARLKLLEGTTKQQVIAVRPTLCQGISELAAWCKSLQIPFFLVSGGFIDLAKPLANSLGFTDFRANRFCWDGNLIRGELVEPIIDAEQKKSAVIQWCKSHGIDPKNTAAIGDGANDQMMMSTCGLAVGFRPKSILWDKIQVANHTGDHRFLLEAFR